MKKCSKCKKEYPPTLQYFSPDRRSSDNFQSSCRNCKKISDKLSYQKHREKRLQKMREYYSSERGKKIRQNYKNSIRGYLICTYHNMIQRTTNPLHKSYKNYGGRGIKCLFKSSSEFADYVITQLQINPKGLEIDRIDNNGHYKPGNVRFVTCQENNLNRRDNNG